MYTTWLLTNRTPRQLDMSGKARPGRKVALAACFGKVKPGVSYTVRWCHPTRGGQFNSCFDGSLNRWDRWHINHIITQLAVYTTYIPLIYCQYGELFQFSPPVDTGILQESLDFFDGSWSSYFFCLPYGKCGIYIGVIVHSRKLTYKMNGWNIEIPFEMVPFQGTFVYFQGFTCLSRNWFHVFDIQRVLVAGRLRLVAKIHDKSWPLYGWQKQLTGLTGVECCLSSCPRQVFKHPGFVLIYPFFGRPCSKVNPTQLKWWYAKKYSATFCLVDVLNMQPFIW